MDPAAGPSECWTAAAPTGERRRWRNQIKPGNHQSQQAFWKRWRIDANDESSQRCGRSLRTSEVPNRPFGDIWLLGSGVAGSRSVVAMTTAVANHSLEDKHKQHRDENMREKFLLVFLTFLGEAKAAGEREPGETGHAHNNMDQDGRQDGGRSLRLFMLGSVCPPVRSDGASLKVKCLRADVDVSPGRWFLPMWSWCASGS